MSNIVGYIGGPPKLDEYFGERPNPSIVSGGPVPHYWPNVVRSGGAPTHLVGSGASSYDHSNLAQMPGYGQPLHYPALGLTINPGDPGYDDLFVSRRMINPPSNAGVTLPRPWPDATSPGWRVGDEPGGPKESDWFDWLGPGKGPGEMQPWTPPPQSGPGPGVPPPGYQPPGFNPGGWPLYPPPPLTTPPGLGWRAEEGDMDPRSLPEWLFAQFPENYAYYDNLQKGLIDESWQLGRQAMQAFNQRQQEMSALFNSQTANLNATIADRTARLDSTIDDRTEKLDAALGRSEAGQQAGLGTMQQGTDLYQHYLNQALGQQDRNMEMVKGSHAAGLGVIGGGVSDYKKHLGNAMALQGEALSANPLKYQHYIDTGTVAPEIDSQLRAARDTTISAAQRELDRQRVEANSQLQKRTATMGMQDSEYAAIQNARLGGEAGRTMANVIDSQNLQYLNQRLAIPYQQQQAATATMQSYNPFIGNILAGGAQDATNSMNYGRSIVDSGNSLGALGNQAVGNILAGGAQQASNYHNMGKANIDSSVALGSLHNSAFNNVVGAAQNAFSGVTGAANQAYGNIMNAGNQQMQYPMQMFQMSQLLPQNAMNARQGYLNTMMDVWKNLLSADLAREGHQIQRDAQGDGGNWMDYFMRLL